VDINFLIVKEGAWSYQVGDQQVLLADCRALLHWDLFHFDCWLFDNNKWTMYTRRRQHLIALRTELATDWKCKANDFAARNLLITNFCMDAWEKTRSQEFRGIPEVQELEDAYRNAKALRRKPASKLQSRKVAPSTIRISSTRLIPQELIPGNNRVFQPDT